LLRTKAVGQTLPATYKNSSGDEIANVNFFYDESYIYSPAPTPINPTS